MRIQVMAVALDPEVMTRSVVFAVSSIALLVAHQVGDHVLQTDRQANRKTGPGWPAVRSMAGHLLGYHATALVVLLGTAAALGLQLTVRGVVAGMAFSAATHAWLDRRWPVRTLLRATGSPEFAERTAPVCGMYVADQALHKLALLISAMLIARL